MIKVIPGEVIRLALLGAHYRQPLDWSDDVLDAARKMLDRLYGALRGITVPPQVRERAQPDAVVLASLEDDLNTPKALSGIFNIARDLNKATQDARRVELAATLLASSKLLGIAQGDVEAWFSGAAAYSLR